MLLVIDFDHPKYLLSKIICASTTWKNSQIDNYFTSFSLILLHHHRHHLYKPFLLQLIHMRITNNKKSTNMKFINLLIVLFLFYNFGGSRSSSCGELGNITYPYQLPGTCNWKAYELQCNGHDTVLSIGATTYLVKNMSIENKTLRLVDPDLAEGRCCLQNRDVFSAYKISSVLTWFSMPEYSDYIDITFLNCTEELEDSLYKLIHCMDEPRPRIYAGFDNDAGSIPKSCAYVARTRIDYEPCWNDTDGVELMRMLRQGFSVSWNETDLGLFYGLEYDKKVVRN